MTALLVIFAVTVILWIVLPTEIGSLFCLTALMLLPGVTSATVFSASFGSSTIVFLIFSMMLTYALSSTGVLRRIALRFIDNPLAKKNRYTLLGGYLLAMLIIGSFIAPTTLFVLFFGIAEEMYSLLNLEKGDPLAKAIMIGTGFFASISCAMTPIAHTFPIMALGFYETATGEVISYAQYLRYSLPIGLILVAAAYALLCTVIKKDTGKIEIHFEKGCSWSWREILSLAVFLLVVACWLVVGIWPSVFSRLNALGTAFPAIAGCAVLTAAGCLKVKDGFTKGVSWNAILLCAATLALGKVLTMDEFGVTALITSLMSKVTGAISPMLLVIVFSVLLTNIISNIVTTTLAFNIFVPMFIAGGIADPVTATIVIGIGASLAYALPSSIAHIALAGSSGWASSRDMMKYGAVMVLLSIVVMLVLI